MRLLWDVTSILKHVCPPPVTHVVECWLVGYIVNNELEGVKHSGCNLFWLLSFEFLWYNQINGKKHQDYVVLCPIRDTNWSYLQSWFNIDSSCVLSEKLIKLKIYQTPILPLVLYLCNIYVFFSQGRGCLRIKCWVEYWPWWRVKWQKREANYIMKCCIICTCNLITLQLLNKKRWDM
jgi:hypothetical protein